MPPVPTPQRCYACTNRPRKVSVRVMRRRPAWEKGGVSCVEQRRCMGCRGDHPGSPACGRRAPGVAGTPGVDYVGEGGSVAEHDQHDHTHDDEDDLDYDAGDFWLHLESRAISELTT